MVKAQLGGKTHWQESNDLEMMFEGTYTSDFYRTIRNLLHAQISLQQGDSQLPDAEHFRAARSLARSWRELLLREVQYRSAGGDALAAR